MYSKTRPASARATAVLIAAMTVVSACGVLGGDDATATETGAAPAAATETTLAGAPAEAEPAEAAGAEPAADAGDGVDEAARAFGRTGPIRELAGLAAYADMDLHPFLVEVMNMPPETPIPDGVAVTYVDLRQYFEPDASSLTFSANFLPSFEREAFKTMIPEMLAGTTWVATGVDEDLENASTLLEYETEDPASPYRYISFKFEDATAERQAKLSIFTRGNDIYGPELLVNQVLFPWMGDLEVDPSMVDNFTSVNIGRLTDKAELDRRWDGPVESFASLSAFYANPTFADFTPGVQEYDDSVWPSNEVEVTRADGFEGDIDVYQTDPEREVGIIISGRTLLS